MLFEGYKLTFRFNARHSTGAHDAPHNHTFEITTFFNVAADADMVAYDLPENTVDGYLQTFSGGYFNEIPPFDTIVPTMENIGAEFYTAIAALLEPLGFSLTRLDIGTAPNTVFSIGTQTTPAQDAMIEAVRAVHGEPAQSLPAQLPRTHPAPAEKPAPRAAEVLRKRRDPAPAHSLPQKLSMRYLVIGLVLAALAGFGITLAVKLSGLYPMGFDVHGHLFKADMLYNSIKKGDFFPLYTEYWYNGVQPFRYWAPLPYYFLALLEFICGGNIFNAYLGFLFVSFTVGAAGWLLLARRLGRPVLGLFLALAWFCLPDNLRVFFSEGNYPRMFVTMLLPMLFYCMWMLVCYRRRGYLIPLTVLMAAVVLGHLMIAAMVGVGSAVFLGLYAAVNRRVREAAFALCGMLLAVAVAGIWVFPSLKGGITSMDSAGNAELAISLSAKLIDSLNPFARLDTGIADLYFGLSIAAVTFAGIFLSGKRSIPGFSTMLLILLGTTTAVAPVLQLLPMAQLFWIRRFAPIAYAAFVVALLEWHRLKKPILVFLCAAIAADCVPSMNLSLLNTHMNVPATVSEIHTSMDDYLLTDAKQTTSQRVSLMDLSTLGPMPSMALCSGEGKVPYVFGWAWQGASTASNITYLNESLENKNYLYLFDRSVEIGADTVLLRKSYVPEENRTMLLAAAARSGYTLTEENTEMMLFSLGTDGNFGVVTKYSGLAVGTSAALVPEILPYYRAGDRLKIDAYTAEELEQYEKIYLSGFFYDNKSRAEELIRTVAAAGVQIYIDMNRIPVDPLTSRMTFLDVSAQPVTFYDSYPALIAKDYTATAKAFAPGYENWNTVYITGLTNSYGYAWFGDTKLDFAGTGNDANITFIGFNLLFHTFTAEDTQVSALLSSIMELDSDKLPAREIVPIAVTYGKDSITVTSPADNVNTTIAWQDIFRSEQSISDEDNFLVVNKGTTVITMHYPYFKQGLALTVVGIIGEILLMLVFFGKLKIKRKPTSSPPREEETV
ncbi:MAG: 6-pyruvoyl-tetrahydropterin synthase-related protein [Oscillospiraceae bacterium]